MFTAKQIKDVMNAQPFKPFRLCMSDGKTYDIPNHDAAWVTKNFVEVGMDLDASGIAENIRRCAILHITSIEDLQPAV
jgi:hypothetical protein